MQRRSSGRSRADPSSETYHREGARRKRVQAPVGVEAGIAFVTDGSGNRADYRGFVAGVPTTAWAAGAIFLMGLTLIATTRDENAPAAAAAIPREAEGENRA